MTSNNHHLPARRSTSALLAGLTAAALTAPVLAQDAVQWRIEDGGNGHWYTVLRFTHSLNWPDARDEAFQLGADLVSLETSEEQTWVSDVGLQPAESVWIGLYQPAGTCEPSCGWQWISGEPLSDAAWAPGEPNNQGGGWGDEDHALMLGAGWGCMPTCYGQWADWPGATGLRADAAIVEWSADCNDDGIVDYGQILDGTFEDLDLNGVPDCCDAGTACDQVLDVPLEYATIQAAIDACPDGGTIRLAPGDYAETLNFPARNIRVLGDPERPSIVRITGCCKAYTVATLHGSFSGWVSFEGLTVDGSTGYGFTVNHSGLRLTDCIVSNCGDAGVILHTNARGEFRRTTFTRNQGRGMYAYVNSFIDAEDCDFVENSCHCYGGGVGLHVGSGCDIRNTRFVGNWAATGGAIGLSFSGSRTFTDCQFEGNESDGFALWSTEYGGSATCTGALFCGHAASDIGGGFVDGGGNEFRPYGCEPGCPADFSDDGVVGSADLGILLAHYGSPESFPQGDLDGDGAVDARDLGLLLKDWGPCLP